MKKSVIFLTTCLLVIFAENSFAKEPVKVPVALLGFEGTGADTDTVDFVYKTFYVELEKDNQFKVIGKSEIEYILRQKQYGNMKCRTKECLVKMGENLKVNKIIIGNLTKALKKFVIEIRIFDCKTKYFISTDFFRVESEKELENAIVKGVAKLKPKLIPIKEGERIENETLKKYLLLKRKNPEEFPGKILP